MRKKIAPARLWFYLLLPLVCFLVFVYPWARLANWHAPGAVGWLSAAVLWAAALVGLVVSFRTPKMVLRSLMVHWMGVGFILLVVVSGYEALRPFARFDDRAAVGWIILAAGLLSVAAVFASHLLTVKRLHINTDKVTRRHRIVQISDVHIGSRSKAYLARIVRRINLLNPDLVVITGDLVDSSVVGHAELHGLRRLRARTFFSVGNHERYADLGKVLGVLADMRIEPLRQQSALEGELQIIGIDDADSPRQVAEQLPTIARIARRYSVLLYHRPHGWESARQHGVDLMLCGHTHNGQIFPFNLLVKQQFKRISGLYRAADGHLYVSPGTGTWGPLMRLGSFNEITCIDVAPTLSRVHR